jgi:hypothetical protein
MQLAIHRTKYALPRPLPIGHPRPIPPPPRALPFPGRSSLIVFPVDPSQIARLSSSTLPVHSALTTPPSRSPWPPRPQSLPGSRPSSLPWPRLHLEQLRGERREPGGSSLPPTKKNRGDGRRYLPPMCPVVSQWRPSFCRRLALISAAAVVFLHEPERGETGKEIRGALFFSFARTVSERNGAKCCFEVRRAAGARSG